MILIGRGLDLKEQFRLVVGSFTVNFLCSFQGVMRGKTSKSHRISGDYSLRDPPVPIPNTEVKPQHADSTWLETAREGRSSPDSNKEHHGCDALFFLCSIWLAADICI